MYNHFLQSIFQRMLSIIFIFFITLQAYTLYDLTQVRIVGIVSHKTQKKYTPQEAFPCVQVDEVLFVSYAKPLPLTEIMKEQSCEKISSTQLIEMIKDDVWIYFDIDGKMITSYIDETKTKRTLGIPIGFEEDGKYYLYNVFHFDMFINEKDVSNIILTPFSYDKEKSTSSQQERLELTQDSEILPTYFYSYLQIFDEISLGKEIHDGYFAESMKLNTIIILTVVVIVGLLYTQHQQRYLQRKLSEIEIGMIINGCSLLFSVVIMGLIMLFMNESSIQSVSMVFFILYFIIQVVSVIIFEIFTPTLYNWWKLSLSVIIPQNILSILYYLCDLLKDDYFAFTSDFIHLILLLVTVGVSLIIMTIFFTVNKTDIIIPPYPIFKQHIQMKLLHRIFIGICSFIMGIIRNYIMIFLIVYPFQFFFYNYMSCILLCVISFVLVVIFDDIIQKEVNHKNRFILTMIFEILTFILTILISYITITTYPFTRFMEEFLCCIVFFLIDYYVIYLFNN